MAISIDYSGATYRIKIPQSYLTNISGSLYELDTGQFWEDLKALEAGETGIVFQDAQSHNPQYTVVGVTYARKVEILNATNSSNTDVYEVFFDPDTQYSVRLAGSNNNMFDLQNGILANATTQVIPGNAAGLIVNEGQSLGQGDIDNIADAVWDEQTSGHQDAGSTGKRLTDTNTTTPPTVSEIDTELTTNHGSGSWQSGGTPPTAGDIADAVWDEQLGAHTDVGSAGKQLADANTTTPPTVGEIDTQLSTTHGAGDWQGTSGFTQTDRDNLAKLLKTGVWLGVR